MASIPGLEHLEEHGWEIVGFDYVSQDEYCIGDGGRIERWICKSASPTKRLIVRKVQHPKPAKQSWTPKIGDIVRLKGDTERDINVVVRAIQDGYMLCVSNCGERWVRVWRTGHELVHRPDPQAELQQAIREVLLSKELLEPLTAAFSAISVQAIAKAVADELRGSWANRLTEPVKSVPLADGLVGVWFPKKQAEAPWTPKVGDWVKVTKPVDCAPAHKIWWVKDMDQFQGRVMQVTSVSPCSPWATLDHKVYDFDFAWLALAEDPRGQPATTKQYRDPTKDDLKNGPIACEYREHDGATWKNGFLNSVADGDYPFLIQDGDDSGWWELCRIEVK